MEKVKGLFTRFATMFIALMCVLGMGTPVMAVDGNPNQIPTTPVSITIGGFDTSSQAKDIQIDAYQIISVNVDSDNQAANPLYIWNSDVADWMIKNNYGNYVNTLDAGKVSEQDYVSESFQKQITGSATGVSQGDATKFYEELAAEIRKTSDSAISIEPDVKIRNNFTEDGSVKYEYKKPGVYLVIVTGGIKTYQPTVVKLLPTYSEESDSWTIESVVGVNENTQNTQVKSTNPAITKTVVENQTVAVGDVVKYKLDVTVPDYPINSANKTFIVEDTMPDGIAYSTNSVVVQYGENTIPASDAGTTYYSVENVDPNTPAKGFKITFTNDYFADYGNVTKLSITYQGTVVQAAFEENPDELKNTATLTYNSDPYIDKGNLKSASASARVYSYRMQINKVDKEGKPLDGAQFEIYKTGTTNELLKFTGQNGNYILASSAEKNPVTTIQVSEVNGDPATGGSLLIKGLDVGTYIIKEVTAPKGYVLPDGSIDTVSHRETGSFKLYTGNDTVDDSEDGVYITDTDAGKDTSLTLNNTVTIDVLNTSNKDAEFKLPSTGGMGTLIFTVGGLFVMAGAVVLAVYMYKKRNA